MLFPHIVIDKRKESYILCAEKCPRRQTHGFAGRNKATKPTRRKGTNHGSSSGNPRRQRGHRPRRRRRPCSARVGAECRRARQVPGDPAQPSDDALRRVQDPGRHHQSIPGRRGRQRRCLQPGAPGGREPDPAGGERGHPQPPRRRHVPHRGHSGRGRAGADARRPPQGGARVRPVPRSARAGTRRRRPGRGDRTGRGPGRAAGQSAGRQPAAAGPGPPAATGRGGLPGRGRHHPGAGAGGDPAQPLRRRGRGRRRLAADHQRPHPDRDRSRLHLRRRPAAAEHPAPGSAGLRVRRAAADRRRRDGGTLSGLLPALRPPRGRTGTAQSAPGRVRLGEARPGDRAGARPAIHLPWPADAV